MDSDVDVYVRLRSDLLVMDEGIVLDRHPTPEGDAEAGRRTPPGGVVLPFQLSGWLRRGVERVVQRRGATVCRLDERDELGPTGPPRDGDGGYHEAGACAAGVNVDEVCLVLDLFGGIEDRAGELVRRPLRFGADRFEVDFARGRAVGRHRHLDRRPIGVECAGWSADGTVDGLANLDGCWRLTLEEWRPEFLGLLAAAVEFLDDHRDDRRYQVGLARDFGAGVLECELLNPLYDEPELRRVFARDEDANQSMDEKDRRWMDDCRPSCVAAMEERVDAWP